MSDSIRQAADEGEINYDKGTTYDKGTWDAQSNGKRGSVAKQSASKNAPRAEEDKETNYDMGTRRQGTCPLS